MCTSKVSKPPCATAYDISTCEFTPCSRRMATLGRAFWMKGAATSSFGSKVRLTCMPGSAALPMASCSLLAQAGLSRSWAMRQLTSSQVLCSCSTGAANTGLASRHTSSVCLVLGLPITWLCWLRPCSRRVCSAASRSAVRTCSTTPSSSLNSALRVSSLRRSPTWPAQFFESPKSARLSSTPVLSVTSMSTFRLTPVLPAKPISATVAHRPPSPRS